MHDVVFVIEMILLGAAVGMFSAALGLGGGVLMVPAFLAFVPGMDAHTAKGTSLFLIIFVSGLNAWQITHGWERKPWRLAAIFAGGSIVGSFGGAWITDQLPDEVILWTFVFLLAFLLVRLFFMKEREVREEETQQRTLVAAGIGLLAGIAGGATGTGGGAVLIPLALMAGLETNKRIVGLSNMVMVATSIAGSVAHVIATPEYPYSWTIGHIYLPLVPVVFVGALIGSPWGKRINARMSLRTRRYAMAIVMILLGAQILSKLLTQ